MGAFFRGGRVAAFSRPRSAVQISVYTSGWELTTRHGALPHRLTSPQMPIYCTWQPLWSRRTSGLKHEETGLGLGPNKCSRAGTDERQPSACAHTHTHRHFLKHPRPSPFPPSPEQPRSLELLQRDLGGPGSCKQKLKRRIRETR